MTVPAATLELTLALVLESLLEVLEAAVADVALKKAPAVAVTTATTTQGK